MLRVEAPRLLANPWAFAAGPTRNAASRAQGAQPASGDLAVGRAEYALQSLIRVARQRQPDLGAARCDPVSLERGRAVNLPATLLLHVGGGGGGSVRAIWRHYDK